ncbi:hypothetical protein BDGGKGIB_03115 [Nodularia sphaerocarpa UHCC 0038]|nr:hypothetical protein BDGGKGIB_03115 [Nodularia sphaerocarpa UHCC 0038]
MGMTKAIFPQMRIGLYIDRVLFVLRDVNIFVPIPDSGQLVYRQFEWGMGNGEWGVAYLQVPKKVNIIVDDHKIFLNFVTAVTVEIVCTMFSIPALS